MSASGHSGNRLSEYRRGELHGTGHGIYAEAGKRERKRRQQDDRRRRQEGEQDDEAT